MIGVRRGVIYDICCMTLVLNLNSAEVLTVRNEHLYTVGHTNFLKNILYYIITNISIYIIKNNAKSCLPTCKCIISSIF